MVICYVFLDSFTLDMKSSDLLPLDETARKIYKVVNFPVNVCENVRPQPGRVSQTLNTNIHSGSVKVDETLTQPEESERVECY